MSDIGDWFRSIPFITRSWFAASIVVPFIGKLGLVDFRNLMLFPELVLSRFHLWRPVTATLYFPITPNTGFLYMVNLYFLYHYSTRLETGAFDSRPADYIFMLFFNWICIVIVGMLMNMRLLMIPLIMSVLYVWAQFNKDTIVSFWFGTRFKAHYLPWVILVFNFIIGGSYPMDLGGRSFLTTPEFLYRYFPNRRGGVSGFGVPPSRPAAQEPVRGGGGGRHNWGQGNRLGGE
ncbi:derlin-1 isoform X2 [Enoplosus armatus]|uniref:derlin-1 isoform X2 n=1 Tax=Enoplosus armatus TaxID=215367 RepID=UPI003994FBE6